MDQISLRGPRLAAIVDRHVGERIRHRRTLLGFTQEQLADALDISYQQVQKYETGSNRVSAGRLYQIATRLDVDMGYFFEGLNLSAPIQPAPHGGRSRVTIDLVRNFNEISDPSVRNAVASLVKSLSGGGEDSDELSSVIAQTALSNGQNGSAPHHES